MLKYYYHHTMLKYYYYHTWPRRKDYNSFSSNWKSMGRSSTNRQKRQARTGRNQSLVHDVCKKSLACSTLGSSAAMLTMVKWVKTLTKSVAVPLLDNQNRLQAGQVHGNEVYQLKFVDGDQMILQELMSLKRMPHTTLDGKHHNRHLWIVSS